ncbi:MAG: hypothetical protein WBE13_13020 [Candidatus Acidiferrum sp.]
MALACGVEAKGTNSGGRLGGGDKDAGGFFGAGVGAEADEDFNVAAEAGEEVHEALEGETIE